MSYHGFIVFLRGTFILSFPSNSVLPACNMLHLHDLKFSYPGSDFTIAISDFAVAAGGRVAIVGPSGSGKSTLLALMAGILTPSAGEIQVLGRRLDRMNPAARSEFRIVNLGLIFQSFELIEHLTVNDNILLPYRLHHSLKLTAAVKQRAESLAQSLGIHKLLGRRPMKLSGGEQQRVAIARALVTQPTLVLADEPTGSLDPANKLRVLGLLFDCLTECAGSEPASLICATHDTNILSQFQTTVDMVELSHVAAPN